jgi:hypothetical protein
MQEVNSAHCFAVPPEKFYRYNDVDMLAVYNILRGSDHLHPAHGAITGG